MAQVEPIENEWLRDSLSCDIDMSQISVSTAHYAARNTARTAEFHAVSTKISLFSKFVDSSTTYVRDHAKYVNILCTA